MQDEAQQIQIKEEFKIFNILICPIKIDGASTLHLVFCTGITVLGPWFEASHFTSFASVTLPQSLVPLSHWHGHHLFYSHFL